MKVYKFIIGVAFCLSTVACKVDVSDDGDTSNPPTPCDKKNQGDGLLQTSCTPIEVYDLEGTPDKVHFFHGGWFGANPDFSLNMTIVRTGKKLEASVETPNCKITGTVEPAYYFYLNKLTTNVKTFVDNSQTVDRGDEVITLTSGRISESLYLRNGDGSYKKQVVKFSADAETIRKHVQRIADAILVNCNKQDTHHRILLRQNVSPTSQVDTKALVPHPRYDIIIDDLRVTTAVSGIHISGYRVIVNLAKTCKTEIDLRVSADVQWKQAIAQASIEKSELICARALALPSDEDMRVFMPTYPRRATILSASGTRATGLFGCEHSPRAIGFEQLEALLTATLTTQSTVCTSNIAEPL